MADPSGTVRAVARPETARVAAPSAAAPRKVQTTDPTLLDLDLALPRPTSFRSSPQLAGRYDTSAGGAVHVLQADSTRLAKPVITHPA
jgi:hypothetical protein